MRSTFRARRIRVDSAQIISGPRLTRAIRLNLLFRSVPLREHFVLSPCRPWYAEAVKHRPRLRRFIFWASSVSTLLLVAVWIASAWWYIGLIGDMHWMVYIGQGRWCVSIWRDGDSNSVDWFVNERTVTSLQWTFEGLFNGRDVFLAVPLWLPTLLAATPAAWIWWRDRRRRLHGPHLCPTCSYDLRGGGHSGGKCPECGNAAPAPVV